MTENSKVPVIQLQDINGKSVIATTSLTVAEFTEKEHRKVVRDIELILKSGKFSTANFGLSEYVSDRGRTYRMYLMDERLTSILLMGFTGKKALDWKIAYTDEFIRMREALSKPKQGETVPRFHYDALAEQHKELQYLYRKWYKRKTGKMLTELQEAELVIFINETVLGERTKTRQHLTDKGSTRIMNGYQILINQLKHGYVSFSEFESLFNSRYGIPKEQYLLKPSKEGVMLS